MNTFEITDKSYEVFEFVEFQIGSKSMGISINQVIEIIEPVQVTPVPHSHAYIKGIIHLRGEVLPVVNLIKMMADFDLDIGEDAKFIVTKINEMTLVLEVSSVTKIAQVNIKEINTGSKIDDEIVPVLGSVEQDGKVIVLVDFEKAIALEFS